MWTKATPTPRRRRAPFVLAAVALTASVAAIAAFATRGGDTASAFSDAPPGTYAVMVRASDLEDTIVALPIGRDAPAIPVASVPHLPGHAAAGSVSPDGTRVALVVADQGAVSRPTASLYILNLRDGTLSRVASALDPLQPPPWNSTSTAVAVATTGRADGTSFATVLLAGVDGTVYTVATYPGALGAFPFAFDTAGHPLVTVIDGRGSTVYRGDIEVRSLGPYVTRDWELSPDGAAVAYIETNTEEGLRYLARVASLQATGVQTSFLMSAGESLGVAWRPGAVSPTFGTDPSTAVSAVEGGFDVPLAYSKDGTVLAVQHWTGPSYEKPGAVRLEAVVDGGRVSLEPATRFLGWASR